MRRVLVALAALMLVGVACSSDSDSSSSASGVSGSDAPFEISDEPVASTSVEMPKSYKFEPAAISVDAGSEVTWTNNDDFPHDVHLLDGSDVTEDVPIGESVSLTFDESGEVYYECSIHPDQMRGMIVVN
jgi:plastocyanin